MTPEEQAAKELAEELGFEIGKNYDIYTLIYNGDDEEGYTDEDHWKLWSLCVRQRVRLNEVENQLQTPDAR